MTKYTITGVNRDNKRFIIATNTPQHYNIWNGSLWENVLVSNRPAKYKRKLVKRYYN